MPSLTYLIYFKKFAKSNVTIHTLCISKPRKTILRTNDTRNINFNKTLSYDQTALDNILCFSDFDEL